MNGLLATATARRAAALLLLLVPLWAVHGLVVRPLLEEHRRMDREIAAGAERIREYRRLAAAAPAAREELQRLSTRSAAQGVYLASANAALASAELQQHLRRVAERNAVQIISTQAASTVQDAGFTAVAIKARLRADLDRISALFHALETETPWLFLDEVFIAAAPRVVSGRTSDADDAGQLELRFELRGYLGDGHG